MAAPYFTDYQRWQVMEDNTILFDAIVTMEDAAIIGEQYRVAATVVIGDSQVWVGEVSTTVQDPATVIYSPVGLESLSLQIAIAVSEHQYKNSGGPNHWIGIKITPRVSQIHHSLLNKSSQILGG